MRVSKRKACAPLDVLGARALMATMSAFIMLQSLPSMGQVCDSSVVVADSVMGVAAAVSAAADGGSAGNGFGERRSRPGQYRFRASQLAVPVVLVGIGAAGLGNGWLKHQNHEIREELQENIDRRITVDDFTQYAPAAAIYALNLCGVRGRHDYAGLTVLLGTSAALMGTSVLVLKSVTKVERPDGSARNSFPSGHTAMAFMGAELLRREFWEVSPWIGVAGYVVAAGTGFFRMYNNRHWLTDVIAGAGVGILSVQAAYWLYPVVTRMLFGKRASNVSLSPFAYGGGGGLAFAFRL